MEFTRSKAILFGVGLGMSACMVNNARADQALTGCVGPGGVLTNVAIGESPARPCGDHQTQVALGKQSPPVIIDSSVPPKPLGVALQIDIHGAQILFNVDDVSTYLQVFPSGVERNGQLYFLNDTCSPPAFAERRTDAPTWPSVRISQADVIGTPIGKELWVQEGAVEAGILALSRTDEDPPFGCTTSAFKGIPRVTGPVFRMRNTGIVLERDFPPPYSVLNWPPVR